MPQDERRVVEHSDNSAKTAKTALAVLSVQTGNTRLKKASKYRMHILIYFS